MPASLHTELTLLALHPPTPLAPSHASVRALYKPVDEDDSTPATWGEWSVPSNVMLLPAPEGTRPVRKHVRKLQVKHTGGGFTASTKVRGPRGGRCCVSCVCGE